MKMADTASLVYCFTTYPSDDSQEIVLWFPDFSVGHRRRGGSRLPPAASSSTSRTWSRSPSGCCWR